MRGMQLFNSERTNCSKCHSGFDFSNYNFENNGLYQEYTDQGRFRITQQLQDIGKFKVPTLRNIAFTAPYMHDGSITTLEEVVEHYNSGGKNHSNKNSLIKPLNLSLQEKLDLISFLKSLSDLEFINKKEFKK
jgi:cytochrome c peroxidase